MYYTRGFCCKCSKLLLNEDIVCRNCYIDYLKELSTYLKDHKWSNMKDISRDTKIPIKVIELFIKNEDLIEVKQDDLSKAVDEYNKMIQEEAQRQRNLEIARKLSSLTNTEAKEEPKNNGPRMRYMGRSSDPRHRR